jgi:uncharacterized protein (DUF1778 family)
MKTALKLLQQTGMIVLSPGEARMVLDALQAAVTQQQRIQALETDLAVAQATIRTQESTNQSLTAALEEHRNVGTYMREAYRVQDAYIQAVEALFGAEAHSECLNKASDILASSYTSNEYWLDKDSV